MPLREQQIQALHALDWLFSMSEEDRRTGRTMVIAVALIRQAARFPRSRIRFNDHYPTRDMRLFVGELVVGLVTSDPRLQPFLSRTRDEFWLDLPEPIDDWLPVEPGETSGRTSATRAMQGFGQAMQGFGQAIQSLGRSFRTAQQELEQQEDQALFAMLDELEPPEPSRSRWDVLIDEDDLIHTHEG